MADENGGYASPPCFMHELDPAWLGLGAEEARAALTRWRRAERERLIALRLALSVEDRAERGRRIAATLSARIGDVKGRVISFYWPFRGEPDMRELMARIDAAGGIVALPVVVEKRAPLIFRRWRPGCAMARGVWNIPIPAEGPEVAPDIVISPVVGFDPGRYRLGYGGGFYDRTLAAAARMPRAIGIGYAEQAIGTIHPQPHDIPMAEIVTEDGRAL
ncbi:MAG: 5-formyltetrahydrofolate cyclo-ligase [Pikeienuella sp.]